MSRKNSDNENISNSQNEENALWSIVGYLLSGLIIWGGIGWGLDRWLGAIRVTFLYKHRFLPVLISQ
jgi:hypothetical protein